MKKVSGKALGIGIGAIAIPAVLLGLFAIKKGVRKDNIAELPKRVKDKIKSYT